ncbi:MAG: DUF1549 and DUF1553 domain-containing protein [Planctomycetota bacterium]
MPSNLLQCWPCKPLAARIVLLTMLCAVSVHGEAPVSSSVSFELDVQPVLTKAGCNSGACHGKQRGQNGFQLSLLAYDSDFDHEAITRAARGRRVFYGAPERSLLLEKAIGLRPHGGGKRFERDSEEYKTLLSWIEQGSPRLRKDEPSLLRIELAKSDFSIATGGTAQLDVTAHYSDGSTRNVTRNADYLSNEEPVVKVDDSGLMQAGELPGETAVMARYMNWIAVANVIIPHDRNIAPEDFQTLQKNNFIDKLVYNKLEKAGLLPSEPIEDHIFLRRSYTDIIGRPPSVEEAREFLDTEHPEKRKFLVERLLQKPDYVDYWANQWADLLRPNPYRVGIKAVLNYDNWIRQQFRENVSYDEFARRLITAKGSTFRNGAVTLFRDRRSPDEMATLVSQLFLGIRLECAKCHHHPFEKWSQQDFYQFAAFFQNVKHKGTGLSPPISGSEETVYVSTGGQVTHPKTGESLTPTPLFGTLASGESVSDDPREELVQWMLEKDNGYFAKVHVNRIWAQLMGRGLVEPVDDLRSTNPATNPELLDALADYFVQSGYDQKELIKTIVLSQAYALSSIPNATNAMDRVNYSRHFRHRFRAETLLDSVTAITETPANLSGVPKDSRSTQIWTHRVGSMFLDTYGRPDPNQDPPCERTSDSSVAQVLHMMNSRELDARVRNDSSRAARLAKEYSSAGAIVEDLYLAIYSRYPKADEKAYAEGLLASDGALLTENKLRPVIEDLMWAMMNSPESIIQN